MRNPQQEQFDDMVAAENVINNESLARDRLSFDGYKLHWHGNSPTSWDAFSGLKDEAAKESDKNAGPIPQGKYAIDPENIETFPEDPDWGRHRVKIEPIRKTMERMRNCFKQVRSGFYVHGGSNKGTIGCVELNTDANEDAFFQRLSKLNHRIELEVRYILERKTKYEDQRCPY